MKPAREKMKEMDQEDNIRIVVAEAAHEKYVDTILETSGKLPRSAEQVSPSAHTSMWPPR